MLAGCSQTLRPQKKFAMAARSMPLACFPCLYFAQNLWPRSTCKYGLASCVFSMFVLCSESLAEFNMQVWASFNPQPPFRFGSTSHTHLTFQESQHNPCHTCTCFEQSLWPSSTCKYGLASCAPSLFVFCSEPLAKFNIHVWTRFNPRVPLRSGSICHTQLTFQESQQNPCHTCTPRSRL